MLPARQARARHARDAPWNCGRSQSRLAAVRLLWEVEHGVYRAREFDHPPWNSCVGSSNLGHPQQAPQLLAHLEWWRAYYHGCRVLTNPCEWRSCRHESERANGWRNETSKVLLRWQRAEPLDVGRRARCSRILYQRFPLERLTSQRGTVACCREMGEDTCRRARKESHAGESRPVWTASSPSTGPKWVCKGPVDLSTCPMAVPVEEQKF
jgi:hypothetical protein